MLFRSIENKNNEIFKNYFESEKKSYRSKTLYIDQSMNNQLSNSVIEKDNDKLPDLLSTIKSKDSIIDHLNHELRLLKQKSLQEDLNRNVIMENLEGNESINEENKDIGLVKRCTTSVDLSNYKKVLKLNSEDELLQEIDKLKYKERVLKEELHKLVLQENKTIKMIYQILKVFLHIK